jgi:hypothetical protein
VSERVAQERASRDAASRETGQPLAIEGGEAWQWRKSIDRSTVVGPWPAFERSAAEAVVRSAWGDDSSLFWPGERPDELQVSDGISGRWARIRVTVEVLDGVP